jgi:TonB-dependent starch-binding outer membrane protein SusC
MTCRKFTQLVLLPMLLLFGFQVAFAQDRVVTGRVTDSKDNTGIPGVNVVPQGSKGGTKTSSDGSYRISVGSGVTALTFSSIGYEAKDVTIGAASTADVQLVIKNQQQGEVVVLGYGSAKRRDVVGAISTVKSKDFNKGVVSSPDQLIQGKVAGVQILNNSGQPGGGTTIRIRGTNSIRAGNNPLIVVDGVPLDGANFAPGQGAGGNSQGIPDVGGSTPGTNPLNFINPSDIASMDVLKDASATAIYGSRGANGVIMVTTKRGSSGAPRLEVSATTGFSKILKRLEVLNGDEYRTALGEYGFPTTVNTAGTPTANFGTNVNALDAILQSGTMQNYNAALSAGNENARYRISLGSTNQKGIIRKTRFEKVNASITSSFKFLDNKRLGLDISINTAQTNDQLAPITSTAGFKGSLIGQALQWNPTRSLTNADGSVFVGSVGGDINPLAMSDAYNDNMKTTTIIGSIQPYYKITNDLEYRLLYSLNYGSAVRKNFLRNWINLENIQAPSGGRGGQAALGEAQTLVKGITHTLNYNKDLNSNLSLNATLGYEYQKIDLSGSFESARGFIDTKEAYYNFMAFSDPGSRTISSFNDPTRELQSFFGRAMFNIKEKYNISATMRADGSTKFGKNNRYGYFPSVGAAWNISKESFMADNRTFDNLRLRASWGQTGNQEFPAGASQIVYTASGNNAFSQLYLQNPDLKWETNTSSNIGVDFSILKGRVFGSVEYFNRQTKDLLFPLQAADPQPPGSAVTWTNIDGTVKNSGVEFTLNGNIIKKNDFSLDLGVNVTLQKNKLTDFVGEIPTGEVNGQGLSGAFAQLLKSGQPLNSFYLKKFNGIDKTTGISSYEGGEEKFFLGSPNPTTLLGMSLRAAYKKLSLEANMNGAFGHYIYNNTTNAILAFNNLGKRNIGKAEYATAKSVGEKPVNPTSASSRYLEKGNYLKMANVTINYNVGNKGKILKNANVFITAQNLFVITKFTGFDPEVNVSKPLNDVPSFGMEYTPYPTPRTISLGINFTL